MRTHMIHGPRSTAVLGMTLLALFACNDDPVAPPEPEGALPESAPQESAPPQDVVLVAAPNTWAGKKAMPSARSQLVAVTVNNIIYAIGGAGSSLTALRTVQAYNPATNSWSTKAQLPSGRRAQTGASSIGNKIYVAGGFNTSAALTKTLYVYRRGGEYLDQEGGHAHGRKLRRAGCDQQSAVCVRGVHGRALRRQAAPLHALDEQVDHVGRPSPPARQRRGRGDRDQVLPGRRQR